MGFYQSQSFQRKVLSLIGGFLIHIVIGTVYITGNISVYMASYLQQHGHMISLKDVSIILPLQITGTTLTILTGSYLTQRFNPWTAVIIGNSTVVFSVFISSYITDLGLMAVVYGLLFGIGVGITYTSPLIVSWSHFPTHKGRISGIIISGFGFGSSIFNLVATGIINPDNEKATVHYHGDKYFKSSIANEFPAMLRWLSLIYLLMSIVGIALLSKPAPKKVEVYIENSTSDECPSMIAGIKTKQFLQLFIMAFCSVTPGLYVVSSYKTFGSIKINDDQFLAIVGSVSSIFNGSFRYFWGQLMDKTSFKISYASLIIVQTILIVTLYYIAENKALYLIWICLIVCCEGGHFSLFPTVIAKLYGKNMGAKIYGALFYCFAFGSILGYLLQLYVESFIGYQGLFWIMGGLSGIALAILFMFRGENMWVTGIDHTEISIKSIEN